MNSYFAKLLGFLLKKDSVEKEKKIILNEVSMKCWRGKKGVCKVPQLIRNSARQADAEMLTLNSEGSNFSPTISDQAVNF